MKQTCIFLGLLIYTISITAIAHGRDLIRPTQKGFSGYVEAALIMFNTSSQLLVSTENDRINSLKYNADGFYGGGMPAMFNLSYTLSDLSNQLYIGTPDESLGSRIKLGWVHYCDDDSRIDAAFAIQPMNVWENPYETTKDREETGLAEVGLNLVWENILGSGLMLYQNIYGIGVEDDVIGELQPDLIRDGHRWETGIGYEFQAGANHIFTPEFYYTGADMDGESQSYDGYRGSLGFERICDNYAVEAHASVATRNYEKVHPLFNKTRKENIYMGDIIFTLPEPLAIKNAYTRFGCGYEYGDTDIDFFDYHTFIAGISVGYNF